MSDKLGFLDSLFDIDGDGKVTDMDFIDDLAIFHMIQEDEKEERKDLENDLTDDLDDDLDRDS